MFSAFTSKDSSPVKSEKAPRSYQRTMVKWCDYSFKVYELTEDIDASQVDSVFILAKNNSSGYWVPFYVGSLRAEQIRSLLFKEKFIESKALGASHIHIIELESTPEMLALHEKIVTTFKPQLNQPEEEIMASENQLSEELNETKIKLELLYNHERNYLELIKDYKEEIKFANSLQEDLRRERSQFFTQTLKDVLQTMNMAEVDKTVSAKWVEDLVSNYTKSIDLSGDLARTHVIEILSMVNGEAKSAASNAKLDNLTQTQKNTDIQSDAK